MLEGVCLFAFPGSTRQQILQKMKEMVSGDEKLGSTRWREKEK